MIKKFNEHIGIRLSDIYSSYPDQNEMIWNFISQDEFEREYFQTERMNPLEIFKKKNSNNESIEDQLEHANLDQLEIINYYRENINDIKSDYLIMCGDILIDGYHRLVAMVREGIEEVKIIQIEQ